uniref:Uncharacterized protein n=1 Tax=Acrobeloides nanus TaxID=290746 RepID=A0A914DUX2_9BILA
MLYAIDAWYLSQHVLKNSIERIKKFAAKLCANDVSPTIGETRLEAHLPASDGEAYPSHAPFHPRPLKLSHNVIALCRREERRRSGRTGHEWELVIPVTSLEAVHGSFLNTVRQT